MTNDVMRMMLTRMTDETDEDTLSAYLSFAANAVLTRAYPYKDISEMEVPAQYQALQVEIAAYMLNKRGAEGEVSHSENGITRTYESADVPASLLRRIIPCAGVV
jgi:hypothetical protein